MDEIWWNENKADQEISKIKVISTRLFAFILREDPENKNPHMNVCVPVLP